MVRGFVVGALSGMLVSAAGLVTVSLLGSQPAGNAPPAAPDVATPDLARAADAPSDAPAEVAPEIGGAPAPSRTPDVSRPAGPTVQVTTETAPAARPVEVDVAQTLEAPEAPASEGVAITTEEPVLPNPQAARPSEPVREADIRLETTTPPPPSETPVAEVVVPEADADGETGDAADAAPAIPRETIVREDGTVVQMTPFQPMTGSPDVNVTTRTAEGVRIFRPENEDRNDPEAIDEVIEIAPAEPAPEPVPDPAAESGGGAGGGADADTGGDAAEADTDTDVDAVADSDAPVLDAPQVDGTVPQTPGGGGDGQPMIALRGEAGSMPSGVGTVRVTRPTEPEPAAPEAEEPAVTDDPEEAGALERYAAVLDNPGGKAVLSVVLIDTGTLGGGGEAVAALPFAVSVALDPAAEGAAERMAAYRAAGVEVLALDPVPAGALPSDAEVALEAGFAAVPEAVALLDLDDVGIQADGAVTDQAMAHLAGDGRGFVTVPQGLNGAVRAADAAGVPSGVVYRDLDADGQDAAVIRRFLDQAEFRARQQPGVLVVGRVRADTLSALTLWSVANTDGDVMLGPASAALGR